MSKYTTELRYICEALAELDESKGYNDVSQIIEIARPKIFTFSYPIFDETYRPVLETQILKHFYTREIGLETYGLWKLKLEDKLNEIMPYFNKLYLIDSLDYNPLDDVNVTRTYKRTNDSSGNRDMSANGSAKDTSSFNSLNKALDTPQNGITELLSGSYLTNASVTDSSNTSDSTTSNTTAETTKALSVDDYLETVKGKQGSGAYGELVMKYRESLININQMLYRELEPLFMGIW